MEVSYQNILEDVVALTEHQLSTNGAYHKRRYWNLYGSPIFVFVVFVYMAYHTHELVFVIAGLAGALAAFIWALCAYHNFPRKAVEKLQRDKPQKEVFCGHTVTVSPEGFSAHTAESRSFQTWSALYEIAFTPDYIFVYDTPATAHIIPRRELGDTQFKQFSDEIQSVRNSLTPK
jgi:YcxB-like protein